MILLPPIALLWAVAASRIEGVPTELDSLKHILRREVGTMYPTSRHTQLRNSRSTAFGLGQLLKSTHKSVGIPYGTTDPVKQMQGIYRYCHRRYGSVANALKFHRSRGIY